MCIASLRSAFAHSRRLTVRFANRPPRPTPSLERPEFTFTIEDKGDPHEYEYTVYMRQSIPTGWTEDDWDTDAEVASVVGQITSPGSVTVTWDGSQVPGGDPDTMPAGVYSFDIFAREYDDVASETRELLDETGFKTPYATWVSELGSWIAVDEEGNAELRVKYMFTDDYDRGAVGDAHVTVLGPDLKELAVVDVPTATGVLHGGEDLDEDGEADGIAVYDIPDWSDASEFWLRHDQGEYCIAQGARGEGGKRDPGTGNPPTKPIFYYAVYTIDQGQLNTHRMVFSSLGAEQHPDITDGLNRDADEAKEAFQTCHQMFVFGHQKLLKTPEVPSEREAKKTDLMGIGVPMGTSGSHTMLLAEKKHRHLWDAIEQDQVFPLDDDPWSLYGQCSWAYVTGCRSFIRHSDSFCSVLASPAKGNVETVVGTTRSIHVELAKLWCAYFYTHYYYARTHGVQSYTHYAMFKAKDDFWELWVVARNDNGGTLPSPERNWFAMSEQLDYSTPDLADAPNWGTADTIFRGSYHQGTTRDY